MTDLEEAIVKARNFVMTSRRQDGMWYNFLTRHHGESADWVTSFTGINMIQSGVGRQDLVITASSVLERQRKNGGFSYNERIVPDADSTAFAIRFLRSFDQNSSTSHARRFLKTHQHDDGGFSTYLEPAIRQYTRIPEEMSVEGWCMSTPDVTASALLALPFNERGLQYLHDTQLDDGSWESYWWTSDVYATSHALEAISSQSNTRKRAMDWLSTNENVPNVPIYLALSVTGLIPEPMYCDIVERRIEQLVETQRDDGSWDTTPILRFPTPSNTSPQSNPSRWRDGARDQNRIFTTGTCLRALDAYNSVHLQP